MEGNDVTLTTRTTETAGESASESFLDMIPEELRGEPSLQTIRDVASLAKGYVHAQKLVGGEKIVLPGSNATDADWSAVYAKLGRPEAPDGYELKKPDLPEGFPYQEEMEKGYKETAHKLGLNAKQAAGLHEWFMQQSLGQHSQMTEQQQAAIVAGQEAIKKEWGAALPQALQSGKRLIEQFGGKEMQALVDAGLGDHPAFMNFVFKMAKQFGEDRIGDRGATMVTPADALSKINLIRGDKNHPYNQWDHPAHNQAVKELQDLYKLAYPEPSAAA